MSAVANIAPRGRHYLAVFLLSLAVLMLEIAYARILSVALFSHYAFVAVSLAMFGIGVSGLVVYLLPQHFTADRLDQQLVAYGWRCALSAALSLVVFLHFEVVQALSVAGFVTLSVAYLTLAIPYFFGGVCLSLLMTHFASRIGRIYAADLVGASVGCVAVVVAMSLAPAPFVVAYVALLLAAGAFAIALSIRPRRLAGPVVALIATAALLGLAHTTDVLRMRFIKGWDSFYSVHEAWNGFSRVSIFPSQHHAGQLVPLRSDYEPPGGSFPAAMTIDIDGDAWTQMYQFDGDFGALAFLRDTVLYVVHHLRPNADVLIIGTGGGRDVLAPRLRQPSVLGSRSTRMPRLVQECTGTTRDGRTRPASR
jgi:hypothetical protein